MVPFQLGIKWFAMGWLLESILLITYGYKKDIKFMEIGGWAILGLCFASVIGIDMFRYEALPDKESVPHFHLRYFCLMLGVIYTLFIYLNDIAKNKLMRYSKRGKYITLYKYFVIVNAWFY